MNIYDTIVIGAGPAGIGAAIQLKHNGHKVILIERKRIGGRLRLARKVENLISREPLNGKEVCRIFEKMIERKGIRLLFEEVLRIECFRSFYRITTDKRRYFSRFVVIATGLKPNVPRINGISKVEDSLFFEWQDLKRDIHSPVLIIGGGEVGSDSACSLKERGFEVFLFSRSKFLSINPSLKRDIAKLGIKVISGVKYKRIDKNVKIIKLYYEKDGFTFSKEGRSILITIGGRPDISLLKGLNKQEGIFVCGDAKYPNYHQAAIAFGDGVNTAMRISNLLSKEEKC